MATFTYFAKRSLIAGHTLDEQYTLEVSLVDAVRARQGVGVDQVAIGGGRETIYYRPETTWQVSLPPLSPTGLAALVEFLDSVEAGEPFTFDAYGSVASPVNPVTAYRVPGPVSEVRLIRTGNGATDWRSVSFGVIEA